MMEVKSYDVYYKNDPIPFASDVEATTGKQAVYFATMFPREDTKGKDVPYPFDPHDWTAIPKEEDELQMFAEDDEISWHEPAKKYSPRINDDVLIRTTDHHGKTCYAFSFRTKALAVFTQPYIEPSNPTGKNRIYFRNSKDKISIKSNKMYKNGRHSLVARYTFSSNAECKDYDQRWVGWVFPLRYSPDYDLYYIDINDRHDRREAYERS